MNSDEELILPEDSRPETAVDHHHHRQYIQGRNIRFICHLFDGNLDLLLPIQKDLHQVLCEQVNRFMLSWCGADAVKILFSDLLLDGECLEGIVKLSTSIYKKSCAMRTIGTATVVADTYHFMVTLAQNDVTLRGMLSIVRTEFPRSKNQFEKFTRIFKPKKKIVWKRVHEKSWASEEIKLELKNEVDAFNYMLESRISSSDEEEKGLKDLLLDCFDKKQLLRHGATILRNAKLFSNTTFSHLHTRRLQEKGCFPIWTQKRLTEVLPTLHECLNYQDREGCEACVEKRALEVLKWWYEEIFVCQKEDRDLYLYRSDLTLVRKPGKRLKGLVIRSNREAGKTSWFQSICQGDLARIVHFKNKFNAEEAQKLLHDGIWLILIDDFSKFSNQDLQAIKALIAGEGTTILGKWLSLNYKGGIPCVILCNSHDQFRSLIEDAEIFSQCKFINLSPSIYLGPPGTDDSRLTRGFALVPNAV